MNIAMQVRAHTLLKRVVDERGQFFKQGRAMMDDRWGPLADSPSLSSPWLPPTGRDPREFYYFFFLK